MTTDTRSPPHDRRRQHPRIPLRMSAEVHLEGAVFTATTRDLSEGGCGLELNDVLPEGVEITVGLFLVVDDVEDDKNPPLWVKGRVVWSAERDGDGARAVAGIRFEVITDEQKKWIGHVTAHLTGSARR